MENYIGSKFNKDTKNWEEYGKVAEWCTSTQLGYVVDKGEYYEVVVVPPLTLEEVKESKITILKNLLSSTDYQARKLIEGVITAEQYEPLKIRSQEWRNAISTIEAATTLAMVNAVTYSTDIPAVD